MTSAPVPEIHILDASTAPLGRIAAKAATLLLGKHRPTFERYRKLPVRVVIENSDRLVLTGKKLSQKRYRRHSGYIGNLKDFSADWMRRHDSRQMVRLAVAGMLPKNRLRRELLRRLTITNGAAKPQ